MISSSNKRDYNLESKDVAEHQYAYDFDNILRPYLIRSFRPFFTEGKALEMGCYKGFCTELFLKDFKDLTVIEGSSELISIANDRVKGQAKFVHSTFENASPEDTYEHIFIIHTLEHLDDRLAVLRKIKSWLSPKGKFFVAVPNAMAPSRQLAVHMGLISHNAAVTPAEHEHGHRITYTMDTLEKEIKEAGFNIIHRGGVFFKALANFQFDAALQKGVITPSYLDACYDLGMVYPELCASIIMVCEN
jgi:2-polyprenyl-3-methyl-5-hydroxy-6-metoxy-1,4-benzoquinol methylase